MAKLLVLISLLIGAVGWAGPPVAALDRAQFEVMFEAREAERRVMIAQGLQLTDDEAAKFWPAYDEFRADIKGVDLEQAMLVATFAQNFQNLDDDTSREILNDAKRIEKDRARVISRHLSKVQRLIPASDALRYFQMQSYIATAERFALQQRIPLAGTDLEAAYRQAQAEQAARQAAAQQRQSRGF